MDNVVEIIKNDLEQVREKLQQECSNEQLDYLKKIMPHNNYVHVFNTIEAAGDLFPASIKMGMAALLFHENTLLSLESGNTEKALFPLSMGTRACALFLAQDKTFEAFVNVGRTAISNNTSHAAKISNKVKYPWREHAKEVARKLWREKEILHNELADWLLTEYKSSDGKYPFSGTLIGITEGNERIAILKLLKEVAKEPEFSGLNLIKGGL
ncbi:MAG: hypothetical protein JRG71_01020 [Deltaproteobacteria bacterium]|nr:hypothetical protein [Deltaproteobacteria bacterium]